MKTILRNFLSVLRRFKMATLLNIVGLSIAFAAFMVIMMQLDYDYSFDRYHENHDRIYRLELTWEGNAQAVVSRPMTEAIIASSPHILAGTLFDPFRGEAYFTVESDGVRNSYEEQIIRVSPEFNEVFSFDMLEGSAESLKDPETALLSESVARRMFGNQSVVGKSISSGDNGAYKVTIGGVYKDFPKNSVLKNGVYVAISAEENKTVWGNSNYEAYIRVDHPENSVHLIDDFKKNFDFAALGDDLQWVSDAGYRLTPLTDVHFVQNVMYDFSPKSSRQTLLVLLAIAFVIVIIAGINFTNFSTALTPMRIKGINTQKVLGSMESTIRTSLIVEAITIAMIAYLLSLFLVYLLPFTFIASLLDADPSLLTHPMIVGGTAILAFATGLLAGLYPSFYMTSFPPALVLKGNFGLSPKGRKLRSMLIGIQFIASFALIIGASFMYLQNRFIQNAPLGYDKDEIIVTNINSTINKSMDAFGNQLKTFSGIEDVTYGETLLASQQQYMGWGRYYRDQSINFQCLPVSYSFLKVLGIEVTEGRYFRPEDELTKHGALIFNEKARSQYNLELDTDIDSMKIVGFMPDVKFATFHVETEPMAFLVWGTQNWGNPKSYAYIKVKAGSDLRTAFSHVQSTLKSFDAEYPFNVRFYDAVLNNTYSKERSLTSLITLFSLIAIFISMVGVFGLVVFESEYRKKEIGIRKVLGSTTEQILIMFNKTYVRILCLCFVLAAPIAWYAVVRWLENFAYKTPVYWWVFLISFAIVSLITIITVTFQNYWTANENPIKSLKTE